MDNGILSIPQILCEEIIQIERGGRQMKKWKDVVAIVGLLISWVMLSVFLLSIPCLLCGYKHIFHVILPAKIQGLYGIKLDKPFVDESAVREGGHYNFSCEGKPCKSIKVCVVEKSGKPYVESIEIVSTLSLDQILSLLTEKYGKAEVRNGQYYFTDWRSWNTITVWESVTHSSYNPFTGFTDIKYIPPEERWKPINDWGPGHKIEREVCILAWGQLHMQQLEKEEDAKKKAREKEIDAL